MGRCKSKSWKWERRNLWHLWIEVIQEKGQMRRFVVGDDDRTSIPPNSQGKTLAPSPLLLLHRSSHDYDHGYCVSKINCCADIHPGVCVQFANKRCVSICDFLESRCRRIGYWSRDKSKLPPLMNTTTTSTTRTTTATRKPPYKHCRLLRMWQLCRHHSEIQWPWKLWGH